MTTTQKTWERNTAGLNSYKPTWANGATKTIRVPIALADEVLAYARTLDSGDTPAHCGNNNLTTSNNAIALILTKINEKLPGYKSDSASQLIKDLRDLPEPKEKPKVVVDP